MGTAQPMPNELPTGVRCRDCFTTCNPDGTCPNAGSHAHTQRHTLTMSELPCAGAQLLPANDNEPPAVDEWGSDMIRGNLGIMSDRNLAAAINCLPATLMAWRCEGKGPPYVKLGKRVFYRVDSVVKWIESCEKVTAVHESV